MRLLVFVLSLQLFTPPLAGLQSNRKPVLIRPDKAEETTGDIPFMADPEAAKEHVEVGDFYQRRRNYPAAEQRYREAIRHDPRLTKAYQKLVQTLEKMGSYSEAARVCDDFVAINPDSQEKSRFESWSAQFRQKGSQELLKER